MATPAPAKKPAEVATPTLPSATNPDNVRSVYCNNMEVSFGPLDARLTFNEVIQDGGKFVVERRANIVMAHSHFQAMLRVLVDHEAKMREQIIAAEKSITGKK
jgi:hypothetical protein